MSSSSSMSSQPPPPPPPTSAPTNSSSSNAFSPSSSPPLILAFLAIGLFSAAMAFVFWRRVQGNRRWGGLNATIPLNERSIYFNLPFSNADIPKLWDLSNGGNFARGSNQEEKEGAGAGEGLSDVTWVNLMVHIAFFKFLFSFSFLSFVSLFHYEN